MYLNYSLVNMNTKKIALIPPGGEFINQDFALQRIALYFITQDIVVYLIKLGSSSKIEEDTIFNYIITVQDIQELEELNQTHQFDLVVHRCWMHKYIFASTLLNKFSNIVFYIKDWMDEIPKEEYGFLYKTQEDYDGIKAIFQSGHTILSHYSNKYTNKLSRKYQVPNNTFNFFPEYCIKNNFYTRKNTKFDPKNIRLLWAGGLSPSNKPKRIDEEKIFLDGLVHISKQNIKIDLFLLKKHFNRVFDKQQFEIWRDWLYEDQFNNNINIKMGRPMDATIFEHYDFGIAAGLFYDENCLALKSVCQAVVSKIALYLEAGIPIIVNEKWVAIAQIVKKYKIGIVISNNDLNDFNSVFQISQYDYDQIVSNIYIYRSKYSYNNRTMNFLLRLINE